MNETKKKITEYTKMMAGIKEKVVATLILFVVSAVMMTTVSFAWMTMSRNPEVTGVSTSLATNGNLEIALVPPDGSMPAESKVGDSLLPIVERNITWGNLINLSAKEYGLDNVVLRPSLLDEEDLLLSPLKAAEYDEDGRVVNYITNFGYATWQMATEDMPGHFAVTNEYGVRALASLSYEALGAQEKFIKMKDKIDQEAMLVSESFNSMLDKENKYIDTIAVILGDFVESKMFNDGADFVSKYEDIEKISEMMAEFISCFEEEAVVMASIANLQLYLNEGDSYIDNKPFKKEDFLYYSEAEADSTANSEVSAYITNLENRLKERNIFKCYINEKNEKISTGNLSIQALSTFIKDYNTLKRDYNDMQLILADEQNKASGIYWENSLVTDDGEVIKMSDIVNNIAHITSCEVNGTPVSSLGMSSAGQILQSSTLKGVITKGILVNFENRIGSNPSVTTTVSVSVISKSATVSTNADKNMNAVDLNDVVKLNTGAFVDVKYIAQDTYGFAIDFFVRTNAANSFLTLQGNILANKEYVDVMGKDPDGNEVQIYIIDISYVDEVSGMKVSYPQDVYFKTEKNESGNDITTWYDATTHEVIEVDDSTDPRKKTEEVITVIGYEGDNRVWNDEGDKELLSINSTTQGSGSCYVFYADDPVEQERSLNLLKSLKVVFIDDTGKKIATASMNTELCYAQSGKVTVPLIVEDSGLCVGKDLLGNDLYAITQLERNIPKRITAIVYLNGASLSNEDVLAASDIQGKLNIQFGSTVLEYPIDNEDLYSKVINVSASVDKTDFNYDTDEDLTTLLRVIVDGDKPNEVKAFFTRVINATQGTREKEVLLVENDDGSWTYNYEFTSPGEYVLKSVIIDGVERELPVDGRPTVTVEGFNIRYLNWTESTSNVTILSAGKTYSTSLSLMFATDNIEKMPSTVQGVFSKDDGSSVIVNFAYSTNGVWSGNVTFNESGNYELKYLILDEDYEDVDTEYRKNLSLSLGITVRVQTDSNIKFTLGDDGYDIGDKLYMRVTMYNDAGALLRGISGARLVYSMRGSNASTMDTELTWSGADDCYLGEFSIDKAGTYLFNSVSVLGNTISQATYSPVFTIISPDPVEYCVSTAGTTYKFALTGKNTATVTTTLYNAQTADIIPVFINTSLGEEFVYGTLVEEGVQSDIATADSDSTAQWKFTLTVPLNDSSLYDGNYANSSLVSHGGNYNWINGTQDGEWVLDSIRVYNAWKDGSCPEYVEDDPDIHSKGHLFEIINEPNQNGEEVRTKVVSSIFISLSQPEIGASSSYYYTSDKKLCVLGAELNSTNTAVDLNNKKGSFMDSYTISGFSVTITDFEGKALQVNTDMNSPEYLSKINIEYKYVETSSITNGGYEWAADAGINPNFTIELSSGSSGGTTYNQSSPVSFAHAGDFKAVLSFEDVNLNTITYNSDPFWKASGTLADIAVCSKTPSVQITAISPDGTFDADTTGKGAGHTSVTVPTWTATEATVYFKCNRSGEGTTCSPYRHNYSRPSVTITLADIGQASQAELSFGSGVHIYNGTTQTTGYTWTANGACSRNIGYYQSRTAANDNKTPAGTLTADTLVLTYEGTAFMIPTTIKINNPY